MIKHTPTPISKLPWSHFQNEIRNCDGHGVAECSSEERAKQIVCAVNSHNVLLEAAKRILKTEDFDIETQHPDCECSFCCLFKAIAKEELTAGDPTEYVAGTTKGDERD